MKTRLALMRWTGLLLGVVAGISKAAETRQANEERPAPKKNDGKAYLHEADVLGTFRLSYVDCQPYAGPEQLISIDPSGTVECFQEEAVPGVDRADDRSYKRKELGRLKTGSLLKGELQPAPGFHSKAVKSGRPVSSTKIQLVNMPGGPGVWFAMKADMGDLSRAWDEIYVRHPESFISGSRA